MIDTKKPPPLWLWIVIGVALFIVFSINNDDSNKSSNTKSSYQYKKTKPKQNNDREKVTKLRNQDCAEFIALVSAKDLAKEFGWTEEYVVRNHRVNVWAKTTSNGRGNIIGKMHPGSNALIIDRDGEDFKIVSPLDNSIGWVNEIQVDRTHYQNPKSYEKCNN